MLFKNVDVDHWASMAPSILQVSPCLSGGEEGRLSELFCAVLHMTRAVRKSRIHDCRDYHDFRRVPLFLAIAVISCHGRVY